MRTQERLKRERERIENATSHAIRARQLFIYSAPHLQVLQALNELVTELTRDNTCNCTWHNINPACPNRQDRYHASLSSH